MEDVSTRRELLRALGVGTVAPLAGCSFPDPDETYQEIEIETGDPEVYAENEFVIEQVEECKNSPVVYSKYTGEEVELSYGPRKFKLDEKGDKERLSLGEFEGNHVYRFFELDEMGDEAVVRTGLENGEFAKDQHYLDDPGEIADQILEEGPVCE